jgi:hypothetical protein
VANGNKESELGMPFGTACARLRKAVLFALVQRLGLDECYRCGGPITSPEELSLDHKIDWLGVDPALFWDVENVAFSHRICNKAGRHAGGNPRRIGPEGTAWCGQHQAFLPREAFQANASRWNGLHDRCRECRAVPARPQPQPVRRCRSCSRTEDELQFVDRRLLCVSCYRERQRQVMRGRRAAHKTTKT